MARKKSQRKRELEAAAAAKSHTGGTAAAAAKPLATPAARGDGSNVAPAKTVMGLTINRSYAEKYEAVKRKQEAGRLRDLGISLAVLKGDDDDEEASRDEEDEEEEDEHAELLTRRVDKEISETLAKIRARDPAIYDPTARFYKADERGAKGGGGDQAGASGGATGDGTVGGSGGPAAAAATAGDGGSSDDDSSSDSEDEPVAGWDTVARTALEAVAPKPVRIKDYVRERLLEDGKLESEESDEEVPRARKGSVAAAPHAALYNDEQVELKRSLVAAGESSDDDNAEEGGSRQAGDGDSSSGDDSDDFFTVRKRSSADDAAEEADFAAFQVQEGAALAREDGEQRLLHAYLENETPDEKEYFLREFVLNNGWLGGERHKAPRHGDSAFEVDKTVVDRGPAGPAVKDGDGDGDAVADADPLDDDAAFVDNQELFEYGHNFRYEDEKAAEIVAHARTVAGSLRRKSDGRRKAREARRAAKAAARTAAVEEVKRQKNVLASEINERLREVEAAAGTIVADATAWDLDGDWDPDAYAKAMDAQFGDDYYAAAKETEADVRADAIAEEVEEEEEGTSSNSKKGKSVKADAAAGSADADPTQTDGKLRSLMEQYAGLDFEDIVGGERLRFAYRPVPADTFGLTAAEILESEDKELNRKVSLRYYAPYREGRPGPKRARQQDKRSRGYLGDSNGGAPARAAGARQSRGGDGRGRRDSAVADAVRPPPSAAADGGGKSKKKKRKRGNAAPAVAEPAATSIAAAPTAAAAASPAGGDGGDAPPKRSKIDKDDKKEKKRKSDAATPAREAPAPVAPPPASDGAPKHKRSKHTKQRTKKRDANRQAASSALSDSRLRAYAL